MITSVKIKDNTKTPFEYVSDIEAFENGREFIFKPGVNVRKLRKNFMNLLFLFLKLVRSGASTLCGIL